MVVSRRHRPRIPLSYIRSPMLYYRVWNSIFRLTHIA
jgi:hypothetical protein